MVCHNDWDKDVFSWSKCEEYTSLKIIYVKISHTYSDNIQCKHLISSDPITNMQWNIKFSILRWF